MENPAVTEDHTTPTKMENQPPVIEDPPTVPLMTGDPLTLMEDQPVTEDPPTVPLMAGDPLMTYPPEEIIKLKKLRLSVIVFSCMFCYTVALTFGLRYGFSPTKVGHGLAVPGTIIFMLLNSAFIFFSMRIIFLVLNPTYPTWYQIDEFRRSYVSLASGAVIGSAFFMVTLEWYKLHGYYTLPSNTSVTFSMNMNTPFTINKSVHDGREYLEFYDKNRMQKRIEIRSVEQRTNGADGIEREPSNDDATNSKRTARSREYSSDDDATNSKRTARSREYSADDDVGTRPTPNPPFIALFGCSFTVLLAATMVIIFASFERESITVIMQRQDIRYPPPTTHRPTGQYPEPHYCNMEHNRNSPSTGSSSQRTAGVDTVCRSRSLSTVATEMTTLEDESCIASNPSGMERTQARATSPVRAAGPSVASSTQSDNVYHHSSSPMHKSYLRSLSESKNRRANKKQDLESKLPTSPMKPSKDKEVHETFKASASGLSPFVVSCKKKYGSTELSVPVIKPMDASLVLEAANRELQAVFLHSTAEGTLDPENLEMTEKKEKDS